MKRLTSVAVLSTFIFLAYGSEDSGGTTSSSPTRTVQRDSVATWKRKAGYQGFAGTLNGMTKSDLFRRVGNPSSRQEVGNSVYLYWECSDGRIQLSVNKMLYEMNDTIIADSLNVW